MHLVIAGLNGHPGGGISAVGRRLHTGTGHFCRLGLGEGGEGSMMQSIFLHKSQTQSYLYLIHHLYKPDSRRLKAQMLT